MLTVKIQQMELAVNVTVGFIYRIIYAKKQIFSVKLSTQLMEIVPHAIKDIPYLMVIVSSQIQH
jgi:hypothetical protein